MTYLYTLFCEFLPFKFFEILLLELDIFECANFNSFFCAWVQGAVNWAEVDDAYDFASGLLLRNFEDIRRSIEDTSSRARPRIK